MATGRVAVFIIFLLIKKCAGFNIHNNACEDYSDYPTRFWSNGCYYNPDVLLDTPSLIVKHGYPLETHTLTTEDNYTLTFFRIPSRDPSNAPIFLMHGILLNSGMWVTLGNRSLAFNLADKGYDVWLGSIRGSTFAKSHKRYNVSNKAYWNFNLDSLAYFDVGAQLKFIASVTKKYIIYVGYSMGSTLAFLYSAGYPTEARTLLSGVVALAPVLYLEDSSLVKKLKAVAPPLLRELDRHHTTGIFYQDNLKETTVQLCSTIPAFCTKLLKIFTGKTLHHLSPADLLAVFSHAPSGTSIQVLKHYLQFAENVEITRYDYGLLKNMKFYHSSEPRRYDLSYIKTPVYLLYGDNDVLASEKSVRMLFREVGSSKKRMQDVSGQNEGFNHLDFFMHPNISEVLYPDVFRFLEEIPSKLSKH